MNPRRYDHPRRVYHRIRRMQLRRYQAFTYRPFCDRLKSVLDRFYKTMAAGYGMSATAINDT